MQDGELSIPAPPGMTRIDTWDYSPALGPRGRQIRGFLSKK